jgi:putative FmdB family regulatory protein
VPTYDYECESCGRTYEVRQRISDPALTTCQFCGGRVHRLLAPAPFILKGGGWYVTDYPSESRKKAMEAEKKTAPSETAGSGKAAEAKGSSDGKGSDSKGADAPTTPTAPPPKAPPKE